VTTHQHGEGVYDLRFRILEKPMGYAVGFFWALTKRPSIVLRERRRVREHGRVAVNWKVFKVFRFFQVL